MALPLSRVTAIVAQLRHMLASGGAADSDLDALEVEVAAMAEAMMVAALQTRQPSTWVRRDDVRECRECGAMASEGHLLRCSLRQVRRQRRRGGAGPCRSCEDCGALYTPTSGRQKRCEDCRSGRRAPSEKERGVNG